MSTLIKEKIQEMVDLETRGWDTKNPDLFLSMIHPDMAWPFPPTADAHDPVDWIFVMGRFDRARWRRDWVNSGDITLFLEIIANGSVNFNLNTRRSN